MSVCPCGSGLENENCCDPFLQGKSKAATAEALMRSRYTAYVTGNVKYLVETVLPKKRHDLNEKDIQTWSKNSIWQGLEIVATEAGGAEDEEGLVEFIAHYTQGENKYDHHEKAQFLKEEGTWYFVDGKIAGHEPYVRKEPKIGRNDPCSCGSGKKYKKCCGV
jgi:SEC-C motif-containing protein